MSRISRNSTLGLLAAVLCTAALTGCTADPVDETHEGTLAEGDSQMTADQSYYDEYGFDVAPGMAIDLGMRSDDFDSFLILADDDGNKLAEDDDSGGGLHARITLTAATGGTFHVFANSRSGGSTGAYTLTIQTTAAPE